MLSFGAALLGVFGGLLCRQCGGAFVESVGVYSAHYKKLPFVHSDDETTVPVFESPSRPPSKPPTVVHKFLKRFQLSRSMVKLLRQGVSQRTSMDVSRYLQDGASPNYNYGEPLFLAASLNDTEMMKAMVDALHRSNTKPTWTLLTVYRMVRNDMVDAFKLFAENTSDDGNDDLLGLTPVDKEQFWSTLFRNIDYYETRLFCGRNFKYRRMKGCVDIRAQSRTAVEGNLLIVGADSNSLKVMHYLLERHADVNSAGGLPLKYAVLAGNELMVRLLLSYGAVFNDSLLVNAVQAQSSMIVGDLLKYGADVHYKRDLALREAVYRTNIEVVEQLLYYGADVQQINVKKVHERMSEFLGHRAFRIDVENLPEDEIECPICLEPFRKCDDSDDDASIDDRNSNDKEASDKQMEKSQELSEAGSCDKKKCGRAIVQTCTRFHGLKKEGHYFHERCLKECANCFGLGKCPLCKTFFLLPREDENVSA